MWSGLVSRASSGGTASSTTLSRFCAIEGVDLLQADSLDVRRFPGGIRLPSRDGRELLRLAQEPGDYCS